MTAYLVLIHVLMLGLEVCGGVTVNWDSVTRRTAVRVVPRAQAVLLVPQFSLLVPYDSGWSELQILMLHIKNYHSPYRGESQVILASAALSAVLSGSSPTAVAGRVTENLIVFVSLQTPPFW